MLVVWQEGVNMQDRNSLMLYCGDCAREIKKIPENYFEQEENGLFDEVAE